MIRRLLLTLALLSFVVRGGATPFQSVPPKIAAITGGVESCSTPNTEGGITVFGSEAWPLIAGGDVTILAAAQAGEGRILAFTQGGLMGYGQSFDENTERLLKQAIRWLSGAKRKPELGLVGFGAVPLNNDLGFTTGSWLDCDVMVATAQCLLPEHLALVRRRLREGAGLWLITPDWGVLTGAPKSSLGNDSTVNRLMSPFGLTFDGRRVPVGAEERLQVTEAGELSAMLHADRAWAAALSGEGIETRGRRIALSTLAAAAGFLIEDEPSLMLPMRLAFESGSDSDLSAMDGQMLERLREVLEGREMQPIGFRCSPWSLAGPFDVGKLGREAQPFGKPHKIEESFAACGAGSVGPDLEQAWKSIGGKRPWTILEAERWPGQFDLGELDLLELTRIAMGRKAAKKWNQGGGLYLHRELSLSAPAQIRFSLEGSQGLRLWVDGVLLSTDFGGNGAARVEQEVALSAGRHHLFVETVNDGGAWLVHARAERIESAGGERVSDNIALERAVDAAIDRAVNWLTERQLADGSFPNWSAYRPGFTAFVLYALGSSGYTLEHPVVRRGMSYLDAHPPRDVYSIASVILARAELQRSVPLELNDALRIGVDDLTDLQLPSGLWSYSGDDRLSGDLSNTLFAALALDAAQNQEVEVPAKVWRDMIRGTTQCLERNSSEERRFLYAKVGDYTLAELDRISFGSTTAAGLTILLLAKRGLGDGAAALNKTKFVQSVARSRAWIESHMMWSRDPDLVGVTLMPCHPQYWWIYGVERVGTLLGVRELGGQPWYESGAEYLLQAQHERGFWQNRNPALDTALGLLFLNRATTTVSKRESSRNWRIVGSAADADLVVRLRLPVGEEGLLECWLQSVNRVDLQFVEWIARSEGKETVLARVERGEDKGVQRFSAQVAGLPRRGCLFFARGATGNGETFESQVVEIHAQFSDEELSLATQMKNNLFIGAACSAPKGSSATPLGRERDRSLETSWQSNAGPDEIAWTAEFRKPVQANRIVLVQEQPLRESPSPNGVLQATLVLNGKRSIPVNLEEDWMRPTLVDFGEPVRIERVELQIVKKLRSESAGFAELVLLGPE